MTQSSALSNWLISEGLNTSDTSDIIQQLSSLGLADFNDIMYRCRRSDLISAGVPPNILGSVWSSLLSRRGGFQETQMIELLITAEQDSFRLLFSYQEVLSALLDSQSSDSTVSGEKVKGSNISDQNRHTLANISFRSLNGDDVSDEEGFVESETPMDDPPNMDNSFGPVMTSLMKKTYAPQWSLCSSLSEEDWEAATNGGRPLISWDVEDVCHWVESFEPLKKYSDQFKSFNIDGKHLISLEAEPVLRVDELGDKVGMVMRAHRRLFSNELALLLRSCHQSSESQQPQQAQNLGVELPASPPIRHQHMISPPSSHRQPVSPNLPPRPMSASPQSSGSGSGGRSSPHLDATGPAIRRRKPNRRIKMVVPSPRNKSKSPNTPVEAYEISKERLERAEQELMKHRGNKDDTMKEIESEKQHHDRRPTLPSNHSLTLPDAEVGSANGVEERATEPDEMRSPARNVSTRMYSADVMLDPGAAISRRALAELTRGTSAPVVSFKEDGMMVSPNRKHKPILPSPFLTSPVPAEYVSKAPEKKKKAQNKKSGDEKSEPPGQFRMRRSKTLQSDYQFEGVGSGGTSTEDTVSGAFRVRRYQSLPAPLPLTLDLSKVNNEFEDALEASYELTDAGTLTTRGFRIDSHGITAVPPMSHTTSRLSRAISEQQLVQQRNSQKQRGAVVQETTRPGRVGFMKEGLVVLEELGRGAAGCVRKALYVPELLLVAVKEVPVHDDERRRQLLRELRMLHDLGNALLSDDRLLSDPADELAMTRGGDAPRTPPKNAPLNTTPSVSSPCVPCPYIVSCFDAYTDLDQGAICLVLEFMNAGSLEGLINAKAADPEGVIIPESLIAMVANSVLSGLTVIHSKKQLHRDIKPSNILLDCANNVKISDFGIGKELNSISLANSFKGTLIYMSPERIKGDDYSYSSDVWSVGLCLLVLAQGSLPLPIHKGYWALVRAVQDDPSPTLAKPPQSHPNWSHDFHDFIARCLVKDPLKRSLPHELLDHAFLQSYRAQSGSIPGSPPVKPTAGLMGSLREIAQTAAQFHAEKIIPNFRKEHVRNCEYEIRKKGVCQRNVKHKKWLPDLDRGKVDALATQLNMACDVVANVFKATWGEVNDLMNIHFATQ